MSAFLRRSDLAPEIAVDAIPAAVTQHNVLQFKSRESYTPPDFFEELDECQVIHEVFGR